MKGKILDFSIQQNSGLISGDDGSRYDFSGADWRDSKPPARGLSVDFRVEGNNAKDLYLQLGGGATGAKDKTIAGILALFLGCLGVHKFYLGMNKPGLIMLLVTLLAGWLVLPFIAMAVVALIEGISYLTKSEEEFEAIYVTGNKEWF